MLKKGSMQPVKKILGFLLLAIAVILIFFKKFAMGYLDINVISIIFGIVLAVSGWLLIIAGRQNK